MDNKICYVVGAGENYGLDFLVKDGDLVIAADGGLNYLQKTKIHTDLVVGDFDSYSFQEMQKLSIKSISLNKEKDDTDMLAAIREGIKKEYKEFHIYCGTGGRFDHTFANIQVLNFLSQNKLKGYLIGKDNIITVITNGSIAFNDRCSGYISVFSSSDKTSGVYIAGLKYTLENSVITNKFPLGVSNGFIGKTSKIIVKDGSLMIVFPRKCLDKIEF